MVYDASGIIYARENSNNMQIAVSADGYLNGQAVTDAIEAPAIASGEYSSQTIIGTQTEVTGTNSPAFNTDFNIGEYVYWIDGSGAYVLLGQIESFVSGFESSKMLLTGIAVTTPSIPNPKLAGSNHLITASENVLIRIPTELVTTSSMMIPDFTVWRQANGLNQPSVSKLERYSNIGNPLSIYSPAPVNVSFTIEIMTTFVPIQSGGNTFWSSPESFPIYIWARLVPSSGASTALNSQTMYRWSTQELLEGLEITPNFPDSILVQYGY